MRKLEKTLLCLAMAALLIVLGACSQAEDSEKEEEALYPVSVKGAEIRVGETTVQALLDQGLQVSWVDENYQRINVDPNEMLEANSYYTGGSIAISDSLFANISFVTEEEMPLGQAVIARLEFHLYSEEDEAVLEQIEFDGTPVTQWTRDMAGERYPDWTGDENMWLHYGLQYKYDLNFDTTGKMTQLSVECTYDVDWSGGE